MSAFGGNEIVSGLRRYDVWSALAWADIKFRYRRTIIGPFWLTLSTGAMVLAVGLVYAGIFRREASDYIPYFATGLVFWNFVNATLMEGCTVFTAASAIIKASAVPLPVHILRMIWRNLIIFMHNLVVVAVLWLIFQWNVTAAALLALMGLCLIVVFVFGMVLLFSVLCTRFRDIPQIVGAALQLIFFLTPIIWVPSDLRAGTQFLTWNPMYALLETVRGPLLGQPVAAREWIVALVCAAISLGLGLGMYAKFRHRIAYWL